MLNQRLFVFFFAVDLVCPVHHHPWRRPVMAKSSRRATISSLSYGKVSCYLTWLGPKTYMHINIRYISTTLASTIAPSLRYSHWTMLHLVVLISRYSGYIGNTLTLPFLPPSVVCPSALGSPRCRDQVDWCRSPSDTLPGCSVCRLNPGRP